MKKETHERAVFDALEEEKFQDRLMTVEDRIELARAALADIAVNRADETGFHRDSKDELSLSTRRFERDLNDLERQRQEMLALGSRALRAS